MMKDDHNTRLALFYLILTIHACQVTADDDEDSGSAEDGGCSELCSLYFYLILSQTDTDSPQEEDGDEGDTTDTEEGSGSGSPGSDMLEDTGEGEQGHAERYWDQLPADTRRKLAHQELGDIETSKQFQMYLQALSKYGHLIFHIYIFTDIFSVLEAKNMYQKNYLEFM